MTRPDRVLVALFGACISTGVVCVSVRVDVYCSLFVVVVGAVSANRTLLPVSARCLFFAGAGAGTARRCVRLRRSLVPFGVSTM